MVCFIDGKPAKNEYRHYKVKTVETPNDFDTMKEVILKKIHSCNRRRNSLP